MTADACIFCGEIVQEGHMVCRKCEMDYPVSKRTNNNAFIKHTFHY